MKELLVTLEQTELAPVIVQAGSALTVWVKLGEVLVLKLVLPL